MIEYAGFLATVSGGTLSCLAGFEPSLSAIFATCSVIFFFCLVVFRLH
ncbi:MAG: hypothetical protein H6Q80_1094 [Deltaproteobacteria bacterium]|jgi:hypothetical protein|nr:hypothetical protein [Deltaproteobacteria bacterium]